MTIEQERCRRYAATELGQALQDVQRLIVLCQGILARLDLEAREHGEGAAFPLAAVREPLRAALATLQHE